MRLPDIAERQHIPLPYLEQIFSKLRRAGLVEAVRGPQGGYTLARKPGDISLADIISVLEGPIEPILCSMPENRHPHCHEEDGCASRTLCNELDGELKRILSRNTLGTLCGEAKKIAARRGDTIKGAS
jgi:Rrf2 family protein